MYCRLDGDRVRTLREDNKLTQLRLAERLVGLGEVRIRQIETGNKLGKPPNVRVGNAKALAQELGVTLDEIVLKEGGETPLWLSTLADGFIGRDFVFEELWKFVGRHDRGYFTLVGNPGEGKSAFAAELVIGNRFQESARDLQVVYHFNSRTKGITTTKKCFANIHEMLALQRKHSLPTVPSDASEYAEHWEKLVTQVGGNPELSILFVIDALDEVTLGERSEGQNVLSLPEILPAGVYFLLTRRRERIPCHFQTPQYVLDLGDHVAQCEKDVVDYIRSRMESFDYMSKLKRHDLDESGFVEHLAELSERNFMYLNLVMGDIEDREDDSFDINRLPIGLVGYYEKHWERMGMLKSPLPHEKLRVIYGLANLKSPASVSFLASTYKLSDITVQEVLDEIEGFLTRTVIDDSPRFSFYHASFLDFLRRKDIVKAAGVALDSAENELADHLLNILKGKLT